MLTLVHLVVSLGMLVIVPLGLSLVKIDGGTTVRRWWPVAAVPGVISLWLGRGPLSITLASIYLAGTLVLALLAANDLISRKRLRAREIALYTALATPAIAAAISLPLGTGIVLLGFFLGDPVELAGAVVLTAGMWLVGWTMWRRSRAAERSTKVLLILSAGTLMVTMPLALSWALGHVVATPYLPLRWMVATHGVANALGFALCGLLAWRRLKEWDEARRPA